MSSRPCCSATRKAPPPLDSVLVEFEAWLDAIKGKSSYLFTGEQIVQTAATLEAIFKSLRAANP